MRTLPLISPNPMSPRRRSTRRILTGSIAARLFRRRAIMRAGFFLTALTATTAALHAQSTHTWNGGTDFNWGNAANWTGGVPDGNDLVNIAGAGGGALINVYAGFTSQYRLFFNAGAGAYTLSGPSTVTFFDFGGNAPKIENNSVNTATINFGVVMNGGGVGSGEINPTNGNLVFGSTVDLAGTTQLRIFGNLGNVVSFNGAISSSGNGGANSVSINQNSTVVFGAANTYTGDTFINAGILQFAQGSSSASAFLRLGDTTGTVAAALSITDADGGTTVAGGLNVRSGSSGAKTITATNVSGTNTFSGSVFLDADVSVSTVTGGTLAFTGAAFDLKNQTLTVAGTGATTISGVVQNSTGSGKLTKTVGGTLTLTGANSYTGLTTITLGTINIQNATGLGTVAAGTTVASGGALELQNNITVGAETLSLIGTGVSSNGALRNISGANIYGGAITLAGATEIQSDAGTLTLNAATAIAATNQNVTFDGAGATTVSGIIATGTGTLTKTGAGTLTLSGVNSYTGAATISVGVVNIQNASALGTVAAGTSVTSGAALQIQGTITTLAEALTLNGTGVATDGALRNISGANNYAGLITLGSATRINSDAGTLTISNAGTIAGATFGLTVGGAGDTIINSIIGTTTGTLTKDGAGALTLTGVNTYTGVTSALGGTLFVGAAAPSAAAGALGNASSAVLLGNTSGAVNASILTSGAFTVARAITLQTGNTGTISMGGNTAAASVFSGAVLLGTSGAVAAKDVTLVALSGGSVDFQGILNENASNTTVANIIIGDATHSGTVKLSNAANAYSGNTTIGSGATLEATTLAAGASNSSIGNAAGTAGTLVLDNGTLKYSGAVVSTSRLFTIGTGGGAIDANGTSNAALTFSGAGALVASGTGNRTLTLTGASTGANTLTSIIPNPSSGTTALSKTGASLWVLGGANTYTGGTTVSAGTLRGIVAGSFGANATATALTLAGGTLELFNDTATTFTNTGTTVTASSTVISNKATAASAGVTHTLGTLSIGAQTLTVTRGANATSGTGGITFGATTMTGNAIFAPGTGAQLNLGAVGGAFSLTQNGAGTTVLTAAGTYSGGSTVSAGILQLNNATAAGTGTITQATGSTGRIFLNGGVTIANPIVISAGVTGTASTGLIQQTGTGQGRVNGAITINGSTTNGGHLMGGTASGNELVIGGVITSSVQVTQRDGRVIYLGGGTGYTSLGVTNTAIVGANNGISTAATVQLALSAAGTLDLGTFNQSLAGLIYSSTNVGTVTSTTGTLTLTGPVSSSGNFTHVFNGLADLGGATRNFTIGDGTNELDLIGSATINNGTLNKLGAGNLALTGTINAATTVNAGTLGGTGTYAGGLAINAGSTLAPGSVATTGTVTASSLAFGSGATTIRTKVGTGAGVITGGTVTTAGTATFSLVQHGGALITGNTYPLLNYTGATPGLGGFALGTLPGHVLGSLTDTGSAIAFLVSGNDKVVWDGTLDGNWNINTTANWKTQLGNAATNYLEGDAVVFQDAPAGPGGSNVTVPANVVPTSVEFTNTLATTYAIAGAGGIGGTTGLTKTGGGLVTLSNPNTYAGATSVQQGTLAFDYSTATALGASSAVSVAGGATLKLTHNGGVFSLVNTLTGSGTVIIDPGTTTSGNRDLATVTWNASGFSGTLNLKPTTGTMRIAVDTPNDIGTGLIQVDNGGQVFVNTGSLTFANNFTITGTGYSESTGLLGALRSNTDTYTGVITINGTAKIGALGQTATFSNTLTGGTLTFGGSITSASSETLLLTGSASGLAGLVVNDGTATSGAATTTFSVGNGGNTGTLGSVPISLKADGFKNAVIRFDRADGYTLGAAISSAATAAANEVRNFVDLDSTGTGFSDGGNTITLGSAAPALGGTIRIGQTRSNAIATLTGTSTTEKIAVASALNGATLNIGNGANITTNFLSIGEAANATGGVVNQTGGNVNVVGQLRAGHFGTLTATYNLSGGNLTLTGASPTLTPSTAAGGGVSVSGDNNINGTATATIHGGGIYLGIDGTGIFNHTGGTVTTNWIVLDNRTVTGAGANMADGIDRYNLSGAGSILNLRSNWGLIGRNDGSYAVSFGGGTVRVDNTGTGTGTGPNITIPLDATIDTVASTTTNLDTNGAGNGFTLTRDVRGTGTLNLTGGGNINLSTTTFQNIAASLASTGTAANLVKLGAGATTLSGSASGYTGSITVSAGRLNVPNNLGAGAITVADSAVLSGEPTAVTLLTLGSTTGSTLFFDPNTAGAITAGTLTVNGANTLDLTALPLAAGPYTAINYTTKLGAGTFAVANPGNYRTAPVVNDTGSAITVDITGTKILTWTGAAGNAWNINSAVNWVDPGLVAEKFFTADTVIFPEGGANPSIALTGLLIPNGVTVSATTTAYTFTSSAGNQIAGATGLTKTNGGTLTLVGPNVYTGQTSIGGGTVIISTPTSLGDGSVTNTLAFSGGGRLSDIGSAAFDLGVNRSIAVGAGGGSISHNNATAAAITVSGNLTGSGANNLSFHSVAAGAGTFILTGNNSGYTGALSVDAQGTGLTALRIGTASAAPGGGSITINYPAAGATGNATTLDLPGVSLPAGVTLNMTSFLNGAISLRSQVTSSGSVTIAGPITLSGNAIAQFSPTGTMTYNGAISETTPGAFTGTLFLRIATGTHIVNGLINLPTVGSVLSVTDGATAIVNSPGNTLAGAASVFGTLRLGVDNALGSAPLFTIGQAGDQAATLDLNGFNQTVTNLTYAAVTLNTTTRGISNTHPTATSTFTVNQTADTTFSGTLTGRINLVKTGANALTLPGTNSTFTGNVTVNAGTLVATAASGGTNGVLGVVNTAGRTITINNAGSVLSFTSNNIFGNGVGNANLPATVINGGTLTSTRYNVLGNVTLNGGTLTQAATDAGSYEGFQLLGSVTVGGTAVSTIATTNGKADHLAANTAFIVADATSSSAIDLLVTAPLRNQSGDFGLAAGGFTKSGPGTMALTATSVYTGATAVTAGTLQIGDGIVATGQLAATTVTVSTGATFAYARPGAVAQSGALNSATSGAGTFNVSGDATTAVTLSAGGNFSGAINVNNGTLIADATNPWGTHLTSPTFTLAAGTTLTNSTTSTHAHIGSITLNNATWTTAGGTASYDGENYQLNGNVTVTGSAASTITREGTRTNANSGVSLRGVRTFNVADVTGSTAADLIVSTELENTDPATVALAGAGGILKTGAGTMQLTGANSFTGTTTVTNGTLELNSATPNTAIPTDADTATTSDIVINGGNLVLAASEQIGDLGSINLSSGSLGFSGSGLVENIDKLTVSGGTFTTGANSLIVGGATVTWSGGTNTISSGGLVSDKHWIVTGGTNTVQANAILRVQSGAGTPNGLIFGGTASPTITVDSDASSPGEILLRQDVTVDATLTSGTAQILSGGAAAFAGAIDMSGGTRTWTINNGSASVDMLVSATMQNGGLTKMGAGTLQLSGVNTHAGVTTFGAGTLSVATIGDGGVAGNLGQATNAAANLVFNGGTLQYTGATASSDRNFTINNGSSGTIEVTTNNLTLTGTSTATTGALTKTGAGTLTLTGANLHSGGTTITDGTLVAGNDAAAGSGTLTFNGGKLASDNDARALANNVVVNNVLGNQITGGNSLTLSGNASGAGSLQVNLTTGTKTVTLTTTTTDGFAPAALNVTSGTLLLGGADKIGNTTALTLSGGTFNTGGFSETLGTLTLTDDSIIDFGGGASTLSFADSTGLWTSGKTLNIWNWSGTPATGGGTDQLRFASNGLDVNQLGQINFFSGAGLGQISITPTFGGNGFVSFGEVVPVPEPSSVATVMGLLGLIGWRERRKTRAARAAERRATV